VLLIGRRRSNGKIDDALGQFGSCENGNAESQRTVASDSKLKQHSIKIFEEDQITVSTQD